MADTVTVACKLPTGITLDIRGPLEVNKDLGLTTAPTIAKVTLIGSAAQRRLESNGDYTGEVANVVAGFGLTEVSSDFWDGWLKQNEGNQLLTSGAIFAMPKIAEARAKAKDVSKSVKTGLEPLDPSGDKRLGEVTKAELAA